jgi:hypothetical protein
VDQIQVLLVFLVDILHLIQPLRHRQIVYVLLVTLVLLLLQLVLSVQEVVTQVLHPTIIQRVQRVLQDTSVQPQAIQIIVDVRRVAAAIMLHQVQ